MFKLMGTFRDDPAFESIRHKEGQYQGHFIFPFGHTAILSGITAQQLEESGLIQVFPKDRVATKDVLESWETLQGDQLKAEIKRFFKPFWAFQN